MYARNQSVTPIPFTTCWRKETSNVREGARAIHLLNHPPPIPWWKFAALHTRIDCVGIHWVCVWLYANLFPAINNVFCPSIDYYKKVFAVPRWSFTWTLAIFDSRVAVRKARKWEVLSTRTSGNYWVNRITVQFNPFSGMKWLMWLSQAEISIWRQKMNEVPKAGWVYELNFVPLEPKAWQITKWCPFKKGYTN